MLHVKGESISHSFVTKDDCWPVECKSVSEFKPYVWVVCTYLCNTYICILDCVFNFLDDWLKAKNLIGTLRYGPTFCDSWSNGFVKAAIKFPPIELLNDKCSCFLRVLTHDCPPPCSVCFLALL